jgi:hypothetical protein
LRPQAVHPPPPSLGPPPEGRDGPWRTELRARIAANKHRVYRDRACIAALEDFLDAQARRIRR